MAELTVTVAGRTYRLACEEGEESRLEHLAELLDAKIAGLRQRFGELGDRRLTVMAGLTLADEWAEAKERARELEAELAKLKMATVGAPEWAAGLAASLGEASQRIERMAHELNDSSRM